MKGLVSMKKRPTAPSPASFLKYLWQCHLRSLSHSFTFSCNPPPTPSNSPPQPHFLTYTFGCNAPLSRLYVRLQFPSLTHPHSAAIPSPSTSHAAATQLSPHAAVPSPIPPHSAAMPLSHTFPVDTAIATTRNCSQDPSLIVIPLCKESGDY